MPQNSKAESTQPTRTEKVKGSGTEMISGQNVFIFQSIDGGAREPNGIRKEKEEKEGKEREIERGDIGGKRDSGGTTISL